MKIWDIRPDDFLEVDHPLSVTAIDLDPNVIALMGTLRGDQLGKDGSGKLAIIIFGYFENNYDAPKIALNWRHLETGWIDSQGSKMSFGLLSTVEE